MRIALAFAILLIAAAAHAEPGDTPLWTPSQADVMHVEAIVKMPATALELKSYSRYYAGITVKGRRTIHAEYTLYSVKPQPAGIYIVAEKEFPGIDDGGCTVIELFYDVTADKITSIQCNGLA